MDSSLPHLRFDRVTKTYPGVTALSEICFGAGAGSVHALMGENGAGKSTLLKTLSGAETPTAGRIFLGGTGHVFQSTHEAMAAGVAVIYQELHLISEMSVAENIFLGHFPSTLGMMQRGKLQELAQAQLRRLGEEINPETKVARLPIAQRQMVEIAKALSRGARVIAFDEPTSSLSARETEKLFQVIRDLRDDGCTILYVTHRMEEVFKLCDACTVLRDGRHIATHESLVQATPSLLVREMVGRDIADVFAYIPRSQRGVALEINSLRGPGVTSPISFQVAAGEILGIFGLVGAGRTELLRLLFGAERISAGEVIVAGEPLHLNSPRDAISAGLVYCTEDRKREGIIPILSVMDNCNISARPAHTRMAGIIDDSWENENAHRQVESLRIKTPTVNQAIKFLSGGNQQKVILGRWLSTSIKVLLLDEPTRGIDVGAKSEIYQIIFRLAAEGTAVVVVSSDLPEVLGLADRVAVMRSGGISAFFGRADATPERVLRAALPIEQAISS